MAIRALGSASGLDLESLVTQLVKAERMTKESRLEATKTSLDSSLSGYGKLKSAMSKFQARRANRRHIFFLLLFYYFLCLQTSLCLRNHKGCM